MNRKIHKDNAVDEVVLDQRYHSESDSLGYTVTSGHPFYIEKGEAISINSSLELAKYSDNSNNKLYIIMAECRLDVYGDIDRYFEIYPVLRMENDYFILADDEIGIEELDIHNEDYLRTVIDNLYSNMESELRLQIDKSCGKWKGTMI